MGKLDDHPLDHNRLVDKVRSIQPGYGRLHVCVAASKKEATTSVWRSGEQRDATASGLVEGDSNPSITSQK